MENNYTTDIEIYLENVRLNCVILQKVHKKRYFALRSCLKYFKIPNIIISSSNSVLSVGMTGYMEQNYISGMTCLLSLLSAIITSIELYLGIENNMVKEEQISRSYYLLGTNIFKMLSLTRENRKINGNDYLNEIFGEYNKLIEKSSFIKSSVDDKLMPLPGDLLNSTSGSSIGLEIGI
jgi:hypothetical protein